MSLSTLKAIAIISMMILSFICALVAEEVMHGKFLAALTILIGALAATLFMREKNNARN